ncbi:MAG: GNAT family N-acetyltransferase [Promethearchaeota archaeon]
MVNIIYRHYKSGDEIQLADLFNITFQQNGGGLVRTPKNWAWRYIQSPGFEPEMCQIAEDIEKNKIIGAVYVNLVEKIPLGNNKFLVGEINDVSCHPDYIKKGIATNLMKMAIVYMEKKGCDVSMLSAGYEGIARQKIYKKLDYIDFDRKYIFIQIANLFKLIEDLYGFLIFLLIFFGYSYIPRFINRIRIKLNPFFKNFSYEINNNKNHFKYMYSVNNILSKYYTGFPDYNRKKFIWARVKVPAKAHKPTYILIKRDGKIIGGAVITHQNVYAFKYGLKIRIGLIHELFLDKSKFKNRKEVQLGYIYLIDRILKAATRRFLGVLVYSSSSRDFDLHRGFRAMNFLKLQNEVIMIRIIKKEIKIPKLKKPIFILPHVAFGVP